MEVEQSHMTEMIYDLALEIIFLLTGEKHAAVKMASIEGLLQAMYPPMTIEGTLSQAPITKPPSPFRVPESNNQKILEVTNKIIELLAGGVSSAGNSSTVCSFMEEGRNLCDPIMEGHSPVTPLDGSRKRHPPEKHLWPFYSQDLTEECEAFIRHDQVNEVTEVKKVKEEEDEPYVRGEERCPEEELAIGSMQEGYRTLHHYQGENLDIIKQEGEACVRGAEPWKNAEISSHISAEWGIARDIQEQFPQIDSNGEIESENHLASDSSSVTTLLLHSLHTQEKAFSCTECGRCFSEQVALLKHERVHAGERPYSCSECGRCFSERSHLIIHRRVHTGEKPYSCSKCGKSFSQKSHLIRHEQVHTGERPFTCSQCGRSFSQKAVLIRHERVHTGEKPYSCSECGKSFSQKFSFIIHKRVHTGERPYSCRECGKRFTNKSNLIRHEQVHVGNNPY